MFYKFIKINPYLLFKGHSLVIFNYMQKRQDLMMVQFIVKLYIWGKTRVNKKKIIYKIIIIFDIIKSISTNALRKKKHYFHFIMSNQIWLRKYYLEIMALVGMASKPLHVRRLQKALQEWVQNPGNFKLLIVIHC